MLQIPTSFVSIFN